jgi:hypothetical protein
MPHTITGSKIESCEPFCWYDFAHEMAGLRPDELIAFALVHDLDAVGLETPEKLNRVAEAYIAHCRRVGRWVDMGTGETPYTAGGEEGYRDRLRDYRAFLTYTLRQSAQAPAEPSYTVRFSKARQNRGMKPWGLFQRVDAGLSKCVSDHAIRAEAEAALATRQKPFGKAA